MMRPHLVGLAAILYCCANLMAQNIAVFTSIEPTGQTPTLVIPSTHTFQLLAQTGDSLADGGTLKTSPDFTGFVARNNRNDLGYLSLNHEISNLQGGVTVFDAQFDKTQQIWSICNGQPVSFAPVIGTSRPCSGGITPWGTVVFGEESVATSDLDSNGYYDAGWLVEIDPETRDVVQKIWRAGNALHENCVLSHDQKTLYWGADDATKGFVFKYVATQKRQLANGSLYVLIRDDSTASTGTWLQVPNNSPAECNGVQAFCLSHGAWNFAGIEDVEIGPYGHVYFSAKYSGRIWRFKDDGATVSALSVFVENTLYPIHTPSGIKMVSWGTGADNLAFDNANNLWVLQDGGDNNIWMVKPSHTASHPKVSLFATTPTGCEPTGISFTPDKRYMFLSFQHPSATNADTIPDATGKPAVFNRGTTVVVARKEFLGKPFESPNTGALQVVTRLTPCVYPNPVVGSLLTISDKQLQDAQIVTLSIFDAAGRRCYKGRHTAFDHQISLQFNPKNRGVYRVQISCGALSGSTMFVAE